MKKFAGLLVLCLALLVSFPAAARSTLATPAQLERERTMLKILAHPDMRAATTRIAKLYSADPRAKGAAGRARIPRAAESISVAAIFYALGEDATRPHIYWSVNAPHRWHGLTVPGSGFGIDNPDNIYQGFLVTGGVRYLLHGRMPKAGPVQMHMEVRDSIPGMGEMLAEGLRQLATIQSEQMIFEPDGSFTIAIDSTPTNRRKNHLAIPATGNFNVGIRQLFTDWGTQPPAELRLERLDPAPPPTARDIAALARRSAEILDRIGPYWLNYNNIYIYKAAANAVATPRVRPGGRGLSASGHYALGKDEALLITIDTLGARSFGIQIADPWGVAYDYDRRSSSLNNAQAQADSDGTMTLIISAHDPGYANWLDSGGFSSGIVTLRWQALPADVDHGKAVRRVAVVKLSELEKALPPGQAKISPQNRETLREARARAYAVRLGK